VRLGFWGMVNVKNAFLVKNKNLKNIKMFFYIYDVTLMWLIMISVISASCSAPRV